MKKIYISPAVNVIRMQIENMVCESIRAGQQSLSGSEDGFKKGANERSSIFSSDGNGYNRSLW